MSVTEPRLVLQLVYAYYASHHTWPTYQRIWATIVHYITTETERRPTLEGYAKFGLDTERWNHGFYADVQTLLNKEYLAFECGEFRLTDEGIELAKTLEPQVEHLRLVHMVEMDLASAA